MGKTHGMSHTPFYNVWRDMKNRCGKNATPHHKNRYYNRGIRISEEWNEFLNFKDDMYEGYLETKKTIPDLEIDRINNKGNYCKDNCRWVSHLDNGNNMEIAIRITNPDTGETKTITQWAGHYGLNRDTISLRWQRGVRDVGVLFSKETIKGNQGRKSSIYITNPSTSETKSLEEWIRHYGLKGCTVRARVRYGHTDFDRIFSKGSLYCVRKKSGIQMANPETGEVRTLKGWAVFYGVPPTTVYYRRRKGCKDFGSLFSKKRLQTS